MAELTIQESQSILKLLAQIRELAENIPISDPDYSTVEIIELVNRVAKSLNLPTP
jgi:hypothetical protein